MEQLREWRLAHPEIQTLDKAASLFGVSAVSVHRYETGERRIKPQLVQRVSEVTGIPPHILRPDVFPIPDSALPAVWSAQGVD